LSFFYSPSEDEKKTALVLPELSNEMPIHIVANDQTQIYSKPLTLMNAMFFRALCIYFNFQLEWTS